MNKMPFFGLFTRPSKVFKYRFNAIENGVTKRIYKNSKWFFIVFLVMPLKQA